MNKQEFYSTTGYKMFVALVGIFSGIVTIGFIYFYSISKAPLWVGILFLVVTVVLVIRAVNLFRYPEICFDGKSLSIRGWFGSTKAIDPYSEMEVAGTPDGYVIKQGAVGVALSPQVVGRKQFGELLKLIVGTGEASNKKVHLTSLTLGK